jgi:hypothetical protein
VVISVVIRIVRYNAKSVKQIPQLAASKVDIETVKGEGCVHNKFVVVIVIT